ncbi:capsular biosynthesis protein, partial [Campylobacter jejuni]|nr:capsular biosynthesis protein [Campylobacter jejuni]EDJ6305336.1 capsular biosynthesis protein [Campylobacter jejuni]
MILITSAKYSSSDFTLEFGKIPPSFLPLGNKRLYEYQIELFKNFNQKVFLSLPSDFKLSKFDEKKLKELNVEILFVPNNLSLGESVVYCLN